MTADHDDDPISAASAGLRTLGVTPRRRVETLGLLAALLDLADDRGEVVLDHALMAVEERLGMHACLEGYEWLERVDVLRRTWAGWRIRSFAAHSGPDGLTEASMAVLQRHLATPVAPVAPVPRLSPWRRRIPAVAATMAAGVAALVGVGVGVGQFAPQAAVSGRSAMVEPVPTTPAPSPPGVGFVSGAAAPSPLAPVGPAASAATTTTTTTSTTLLPGLPCLARAVDDLASGAPGILACP